MMAMQKTEKTMAELQIDLNMSFEFDKITESGESLQPLSGPRWLSMASFTLLPKRCSGCSASERPQSKAKYCLAAWEGREGAYIL